MHIFFAVLAVIFLIFMIGEPDGRNRCDYIAGFVVSVIALVVLTGIRMILAACI